MSRLPLPCLMLVTDRSLAGGAEGLVVAVEDAIEGGADAVQLREKDARHDELLSLAARVEEATMGRALLMVNGPRDVAVTAGADGVHLPEDAPFPERPWAGFLVGRSVHSVEAALRAQSEGADYVIAGPVYETPSHPGRRPAGVELIQEVAAAVVVPVLAIGGVTAERVADVVRAGASGVAVISAVLASADRREAARQLREALDSAWVRRPTLEGTS